MIGLTKKELTARQFEVLKLISEEGLCNAEVAERLHITESTVKNHLNHIYIKLGIFSARAAIVHYYKNIKQES